MNIGRFVHFSICGVIRCFHWIYENQPASIFDEPMLNKVQEWYKTNNLQCVLYVFEKCSDFRLEQLQDCYWEEIKKESGWLKLAWCQEKEQEENDEESSINSLERTYRIIITKAGEATWARTVHLHMGTATEALLEKLKEKKVKELLTSDTDKQNYQLAAEDVKLLTEKGVIKKDNLFYRKTHVLLDVLADKVTVETLLTETEAMIKKYLRIPRVEVFCNESQFNKMVLQMDQYWDGFKAVRVPIITDAGVVVENKLYFTACNLDYLFKMDLQDEVVNVEAELPTGLLRGERFAAIIYYNGFLWMIPKRASEIMVLHLKTKQTTTYNLPFLQKEENEENALKIRDTVQKGRFLWLLPYMTECVICIDMEMVTYEIITTWTDEYSADRMMNYLEMQQYGKALYLLRNDASKNIKINMPTGEITEWAQELPVSYGTLVDDETVLYVPINGADCLKEYQINSGKEKNIFSFDEILPEGYIRYAFWKMKHVEDKIYILPHEAKGMLVYNRLSKQIKYVSLEVKEYQTWYDICCFAGSNVFKVEDKIFVFPVKGSSILCVADDLKQTREIPLTISVQKMAILGNISVEREEYRLENYIQHIKDNCARGEKKGHWNVKKEPLWAQICGT